VRLPCGEVGAVEVERELAGTGEFCGNLCGYSRLSMPSAAGRTSPGAPPLADPRTGGKPLLPPFPAQHPPASMRALLLFHGNQRIPLRSTLITGRDRMNPLYFFIAATRSLLVLAVRGMVRAPEPKVVRHLPGAESGPSRFAESRWPPDPPS